MEFRWNDWNIGHIAKHGVTIHDAMRIASNAKPPYPEITGDEKFRVVGRGTGDRFIQVVYIVDEDGTTYIIHARPLNDTEKRRHRRRSR